MRKSETILIPEMRSDETSLRTNALKCKPSTYHHLSAIDRLWKRTLGHLRRLVHGNGHESLKFFKGA
ncbi:hypothetical protein GJ496_009470 [Pomphorhynchus laevis]|nr:hypothetical protein GJ496_009470 [Pomphorhynchus laevis]